MPKKSSEEKSEKKTTKRVLNPALKMWSSLVKKHGVKPPLRKTDPLYAKIKAEFEAWKKKQPSKAKTTAKKVVTKKKVNKTKEIED